MLFSPTLISPILPFPSTISHTFIFNVDSSGDQITQNNLVIENILDNSIVYNQIVESFQYSHSIDANTLINGTQYRAKIRVGNINNEFSDFSDSVVFYCFSTPLVSMSNITEGIVVNSSSVTPIGVFTQLEDEELESYRYYLYDSNSVLLSVSTEKFDGLLTHTFSGLKDNESYKIELKTYTVNSITTSSGLISFSVNYISPKFYSALELENINDRASIKINSHIIDIVGQVNSGEISYEDDEWVNLNSGSIYFDDGFNIENNFTLRFWCKYITEYETLIELISTSGGSIVVKYFNNQFHVFKNLSTLNPYYIYSDEIILSQYILTIPGIIYKYREDNTVCVQIQQYNNLMNINCEVIT